MTLWRHGNPYFAGHLILKHQHAEAEPIGFSLLFADPVLRQVFGMSIDLRRRWLFGNVAGSHEPIGIAKTVE